MECAIESLELMSAFQEVLAYCDRVIETLRRDLLDHVIIRDEAHLTRLLKDYLRYYHEDRTHLGLNKDSPSGRPREMKHNGPAMVAPLPRCGQLHHRYRWTHAACATCFTTNGASPDPTRGLCFRGT